MHSIGIAAENVYCALVHRINNLTGIRALAALWVVLFHLNLLDTPLRGRLGVVVEHGFFGVDLFFVLSGFVLTLVYADRMPPHFRWKQYGDFLLRRVAKIYPLHLLTLFAMGGLVLVAGRLRYVFTSGADNTVWSALCSLVLVQAFGTTKGLSWNGPSWSVSAEWFAYAFLLFPFVRLLRSVHTRWIAVAAMLLLALLALATPLLGMPWNQLDTRGALRIVPDFLCGYLLYRLLHGRVLPTGGVLTAAGAALLLVACYVPYSEFVLLLPGTMLLLAGMYRGGVVTDGVFGNRLLVLLGEASYSIYLLQDFVLIATKQVLKRTHLAHTSGLGGLVLVLVPLLSASSGVLCFRLVEEPLRLAFLRRTGLLRSAVVAGERLGTQVAATIS